MVKMTTPTGTVIAPGPGMFDFGSKVKCVFSTKGVVKSDGLVSVILPMPISP